MNTKVVAGLTGLAVAGVIAGAILIPRLGGNAADAGSDADARAAKAKLEMDNSPEALAAARAKRLEQDKALAALKAELARAEPYAGRTDEERLAAAWEWVRANRDPDRPYNELEAKMLALWDVILDAEPQSPLFLINASLIEVEMIRALDADGDGSVSDEELAAFQSENMDLMTGVEHPYLKDRLDTDGDGNVTMEEMQAVVSLMGESGAFAGVVERAKLEKWDTNRDGILSDAERTDAKDKSGGVEELIRQQMDAMEKTGMFDGDEGEAKRTEMEAQMKAQMAQFAGENGDAFTDMMTAQQLMEAMRVENTNQQELMAEAMKEAPPFPDYMSFDADGDGAVGETEQAAFDQAVQQYNTDAMARNNDMMGRYMRLQFEHAAGQSDANGDGRLTPDEWESRLDMLLAQREERLFLNSYDLDDSGAVGPNELMFFLDWHKAGSLRADANFDGVVDVRDLEKAMKDYQRLAK